MARRGTRCGSPQCMACRVPSKIIRLMTTWVRQNPPTAKITETDQSWFVKQKVSAERGIADTSNETGQARPRGGGGGGGAAAAATTTSDDAD